MDSVGGKGGREREALDKCETSLTPLPSGLEVPGKPVRAGSLSRLTTFLGGVLSGSRCVGETAGSTNDKSSSVSALRFAGLGGRGGFLLDSAVVAGACGWACFDEEATDLARLLDDDSRADRVRWGSGEPLDFDLGLLRPRDDEPFCGGTGLSL